MAKKKSGMCDKCKSNPHIVKCTIGGYGNHHSYNGKPAMKYRNGTRKWYYAGHYHRDEGPAVIYADGTKAWWFMGEELTEQEWKKKVKTRSKKNDTDLSLLLVLIPFVLLGLWIKN